MTENSIAEILQRRERRISGDSGQKYINAMEEYDTVVDFIASHPAVYSTEIRPLLGLGRAATNNHLEHLEAEGRIASRRPHDNLPRLWYVP